MKKIAYIILIFGFLACGKTSSNDHIQTEPTVETSGIRPKVKVYIENSGSMDGYVKGVTDFEQAIYNYLTDIRISDLTDSMQFNYINSAILQQSADISSFIENLEPSVFQARGGNRSSTDIAQALQLLLSQQNDSVVSIFVSDCIFSPDRGKKADEYLINQQIAIKLLLAEHLKKYDTALIIYQLNSQFSGLYYNCENRATSINARRPFYIWLLGKPEYLKRFREKIPDNKFKGSGVENVFSMTSGKKEIPYAVRLGSGDFKLDQLHPKNHIVNAKKSTVRKDAGQFTFSVDTDLSDLLLDENYWNETTHFRLNDKDFQLKIARSPRNSKGYATAFNFSSSIVKQSDLSVQLLKSIPTWVETKNDDSGRDIHAPEAMSKTFGIKYLIGGIYEAYTHENDYYAELKISINK